MTKLQMIYVEMFLMLFGFFYMYNAYGKVVLILVAWALGLALFNLHVDAKMIRRSLGLFGIQLLMILASGINSLFEQVIILCMANTLVWESFMVIYQDGDNYLRLKMEHIIYVIILLYLGFMMLWVLMPLAAKLAFVSGQNGDMVLLVTIQLLFVPAISRFILEKIC
ncbi:MAG: hypothetical protein MR210_01905 [Erysipelotrichaceae bacterium]|nr:hypothetical protein [Erysipelotrichaceae bacterium]MDY5252079.1 hypothetical protein [Erysipelotrichaceae bacterium]